MKKKPQSTTTYQPERTQGRDNRLREIRKVINHPEHLDDMTVDMLYSILYNA